MQSPEELTQQTLAQTERFRELYAAGARFLDLAGTQQLITLARETFQHASPEAKSEAFCLLMHTAMGLIGTQSLPRLSFVEMLIHEFGERGILSQMWALVSAEQQATIAAELSKQILEMLSTKQSGGYGWQRDLAVAFLHRAARDLVTQVGDTVAVAAPLDALSGKAP